MALRRAAELSDSEARRFRLLPFTQRWARLIVEAFP